MEQNSAWRHMQLHNEVFLVTLFDTRQLKPLRLAPVAYCYSYFYIAKSTRNTLDKTMLNERSCFHHTILDIGALNTNNGLYLVHKLYAYPCFRLLIYVKIVLL